MYLLPSNYWHSINYWFAFSNSPHIFFCSSQQLHPEAFTSSLIADILFKSVGLFGEEIFTIPATITTGSYQGTCNSCVASVLIVQTYLLSEQIHIKNALWIQFKKKFKYFVPSTLINTSIAFWKIWEIRGFNSKLKLMGC